MIRLVKKVMANDTVSKNGSDIDIQDKLASPSLFLFLFFTFLVPSSLFLFLFFIFLVPSVLSFIFWGAISR